MTLLKKKLKHSFLLKARKVCEVTWWLHSYPLNRKCPQRVLSIKEGERNNPFSLLLMGAKCYLEIFWCLFSLQNVTIHRLLRGGGVPRQPELRRCLLLRNPIPGQRKALLVEAFCQAFDYSENYRRTIRLRHQISFGKPWWK